MSRRAKVVLAVLTAWPLVYLVLFLAWFAMFIASDGDPAGPSFEAMFGVHLATMAVVIALVAFYIVHVLRSDRLPEDQRLVWVIALALAGVFTAPVYWYLHIWKDRTPGPAGVRGPRPSSA